jgi:hypothetical protein
MVLENDLEEVGGSTEFVEDPTWHDITRMVADPGFWRWRDQVAATGGCADPIHLTGRSRMVLAGSGTVVREYTTADEPDHRLLVAFGNRRASRCPSCAETYRADTYQLVKAGLVGGKGVSPEVRSHPRVFATFTAPSFGAVHHRVVGPHGKVRRCRPHGQARCRRRHRENDPLLGQPLDPDRYDYEGAVVWNAMAPRLWEKTMDLLTKELAKAADYRNRDFARLGRRSFGKVCEVQARGLVHYHSIIRLDGVDPTHPGAVVPPGVWASVDVLERAIRAAAARALVMAPDGRKICWGEQVDIRPVDALGADESLSDEAVAGYIAKYATKSAECTGTVDSPVLCRSCKGTGGMELASVDQTGKTRRVECDRCEGSGNRQSLDSLPVSEHARRMIQACWELGGRPEFAGLKLRKWAHMLGYGGHFSTKSRCYSTTLTALRNVRRDYQSARTLAAVGIDPAGARLVRLSEQALFDLEDVRENDVLVVGHWRFAGRGHGPAQALFATTIARDLADNRRWARLAALYDDRLPGDT